MDMGCWKEFWPFGNRLRSTQCREFLYSLIHVAPSVDNILNIALMLADFLVQVKSEQSIILRTKEGKIVLTNSDEIGLKALDQNLYL